MPLGDTTARLQIMANILVTLNNNQSPTRAQSWLYAGMRMYTYKGQLGEK